MDRALAQRVSAGGDETSSICELETYHKREERSVKKRKRTSLSVVKPICENTDNVEGRG